MNVLLFVLGALFSLIVGANVLFALVLPRRPRGFERISLKINSFVRMSFIGLSQVATRYETKDAILAPTGPVCIVAQLVSWAGGFIVAFALMLHSTTHSFATAFQQATTSLFTVGAIHAGGPANIALDIIAGATWVVVVTLQIAYLPSLYASFNRREGLVALLESRSGVPAWAPEILMRHQIVGITDTLPDFYATWEAWSAELAESHTTYPVLLLFRSPEPWYSWLVGLLSVLDAAALHLTLSPARASSNARLCLRMGFTALNRIAVTLGWDVESDPDPASPIQLTYAEFEEAVTMMRETGFEMERSAEEAWPDFVGWRVNYEKVAYRLAARIVAPPAPWSGPRPHVRLSTESPHRPPQRTPRGFSSGSVEPHSLSGDGDDASLTQADS
ncbi:MAG TPA: hypothetical protein VND89_01815 [Acidimicrobiales bacterium]|nr:hypothetical protein [Acidimicrobiales bacterium]